MNMRERNKDTSKSSVAKKQELTLHPLKFEEVVKSLLNTKPERANLRPVKSESKIS